MRGTKWATVEDVAKDARMWVEGLVAQYQYPENMCGLCGIAAGRIHHALEQEGIKALIHFASWDHLYVVVDNHVVDVTATQFDEFENEFIVIEPLKKLKEYEFYKTCKMFERPFSVIKHQARKGWPPHQIIPKKPYS